MTPVVPITGCAFRIAESLTWGSHRRCAAPCAPNAGPRTSGASKPHTANPTRRPRGAICRPGRCVSELPRSPLQVLFMDKPDACNLSIQGVEEPRHPVLVSLAMTNHELPAPKVAVINPQADACPHLQASTVKQSSLAPRLPVDARQHPAELFADQEQRQPLPYVGDISRPPTLMFSTFSDRTRIALSAWSCVNDAADQQTARCVRIRSNAMRPMSQGMALAVAENEAADPLNVRPLGADAAVLDPDARPHLIEQLRTATRDDPYLNLAFVAYCASTGPA